MGAPVMPFRRFLVQAAQARADSATVCHPFAARDRTHGWAQEKRVAIVLFD
jgi:hypothetical protein